MQRWYTPVLALVALLAAGCATTLPELSLEPVPANPAPTVQEALVTPTVGSLATGDDGDTATATAAPDAPAPSGVLRLGVVSEPSFDPLTASVVTPTDMVVLDLLYDGLTRWDVATGTWAPELAQDIERSGDRLSWTVTLREATFSDGTPITAAAVAQSFDRVLDGGVALATTRLEMVSGVSALDDRTVLIELSEPFALLPELLSSPVYGIVPGGDLSGAVGSGPAVLTEAGRLRVREDLVGGAEAEQSLGFTGVDFVPVSDDSEAAALEAAGEIDLAYLSASHEGGVDLAVATAIEAHYVLNAGSRDLGDAEIRAAVVEAVGRSAVTEASFGDAAVAIDRVVPELLACADPCDGSAGKPTAVSVAELSVAYVADSSGREAAMADALVAELGAAGIAADATGYDIETFVERAALGLDDIVRAGWVGLFPSPDSQLAPYESTSSDNVSSFASEEFDAMLAQARRFGDAASYADAQAELASEAVVIPIARMQIRALVSDRVSGLTLRHDGSFDVHTLSVRGDA